LAWLAGDFLPLSVKYPPVLEDEDDDELEEDFYPSRKPLVRMPRREEICST